MDMTDLFTGENTSPLFSITIVFSLISLPPFLVLAFSTLSVSRARPVAAFTLASGIRLTVVIMSVQSIFSRVRIALMGTRETRTLV